MREAVTPVDDTRDDQAPRFSAGDRPLIEVVRWARRQLARGADRLDLVVPDPDEEAGPGPDPRRNGGGVPRSWRAYLDLAEALGCRCRTPAPVGDGRVLLRFEPLGPEAPWHAAPSGPDRYADEAGFAQVRKLEHPGFLLPLLAALERTRPPDGGRVLVLGCHRGDEIAALTWLDPPPLDLEVVGVDHAVGPLAHARRRFPSARFLEADVNALPESLGRFDLVVAVAVLQGPRVDDKAVVRALVQRHLRPAAGVVLGFPNSRFRGGEVVWGARTRNYREPDLSLVVRDLAAHRRYLLQHGFVTHIGGRYDLLLSAWRGRHDGGTGAAGGPARGQAGGSLGGSAHGPADGPARRAAGCRTTGGSAR